jgi:hypothetical protein
MEQLLISLAQKYGMEKAMELLGLEQEEENQLVYGMPFMGKEISFDPLKSLGRFGLNKAMSGGMTGIMGPAALLGGALMLGRAFDPMRPGSRNYSPNLRGQVDYLSGISGMIGKDPNSGLMKYGPGSVLAGKNVVSMFGSNNYQTALDNKINYFENRIKKGKPINEDRYEQAKKEKEEFFEYKADVKDKGKTKDYGPYTGGGKGNSGDHDGGASADAQSDDAAGMGGYRRGGRISYSRGGIASL